MAAPLPTKLRPTATAKPIEMQAAYAHQKFVHLWPPLHLQQKGHTHLGPTYMRAAPVCVLYAGEYFPIIQRLTTLEANTKKAGPAKDDAQLQVCGGVSSPCRCAPCV